MCRATMSGRMLGRGCLYRSIHRDVMMLPFSFIMSAHASCASHTTVMPSMRSKVSVPIFPLKPACRVCNSSQYAVVISQLDTSNWKSFRPTGIICNPAVQLEHNQIDRKLGA